MEFQIGLPHAVHDSYAAHRPQQPLSLQIGILESEPGLQIQAQLHRREV